MFVSLCQLILWLSSLQLNTISARNYSSKQMEKSSKHDSMAAITNTGRESIYALRDISIVMRGRKHEMYRTQRVTNPLIMHRWIHFDSVALAIAQTLLFHIFFSLSYLAFVFKFNSVPHKTFRACQNRNFIYVIGSGTVIPLANEENNADKGITRKRHNGNLIDRALLPLLPLLLPLLLLSPTLDSMHLATITWISVHWLDKMELFPGTLIIRKDKVSQFTTNFVFRVSMRACLCNAGESIQSIVSSVKILSHFLLWKFSFTLDLETRPACSILCQTRLEHLIGFVVLNIRCVLKLNEPHYISVFPLIFRFIPSLLCQLWIVSSGRCIFITHTHCTDVSLVRLCGWLRILR